MKMCRNPTEIKKSQKIPNISEQLHQKETLAGLQRKDDKEAADVDIKIHYR